MKPITILALLLFSCSLLQAQEDTESASKSIEVGLNITNTLAGFLNSGGQSAPLDPYLISLKFMKQNRGLRTGLNFKVSNTNEFDNFAGGNQRKTKETTVNFRLGFEKRIPISSRLTLFWGVDAVTRYQVDNVDFFSFNGKIELAENTIGFGGGPVLGMIYHINPRVFLSTESYIYAVYQLGNKFELLDPNAPSPSESKIRELDIIPVYPNALYITFLF